MLFFSWTYHFYNIVYFTFNLCTNTILRFILIALIFSKAIKSCSNNTLFCLINCILLINISGKQQKTMQSLHKWITNRLGANIFVFKKEASKSAVCITTLPTGYCDGCLGALGALKSRDLPFCKLKIKKKKKSRRNL